MMIEPLVKELLEAGVHFGHQTHRWNPKMKRFIFGEKNGIYIVDLQKTAESLEEAKAFLRSVATEGGPVLFIGTKRQAQNIVADEATRCSQHFVNLRWLGGLLTNFQTVRKSIERLKTIRSWREDGTLARMTKKEAARAEAELVRLEKVFSGIIEMPRLPKAVFVIDAKREETAIKEAVRLKIPVVALVDTNSDPDPIAHVIPGNDDAIRSIKLVTQLLTDAILEGHQAYLANQAEEEIQKQKAEAEAEAQAQAAAQTPEVPEELEKVLPEATLKVVIEEEPPKKPSHSKEEKTDEQQEIPKPKAKEGSQDA